MIPTEVLVEKYSVFNLSKGLLTGTVFSMCVVFSLIANAQYHIATGELRHSTMSTSIEGCSNVNFTLVQA